MVLFGLHGNVMCKSLSLKEKSALAESLLVNMVKESRQKQVNRNV